MEKEQPPQATGGDTVLAFLLDQPLILASASPRRAEILKAAGLPFRAIAADIDESLKDSEGPIEYVKRLAREKVEAVARVSKGIVLGADTTVVVAGEILAKPIDDHDAARMLKLLRGRWHEVVTGVAVHNSDRADTVLVEHQITRVRFGDMTDDEVAWYVGTKEPMDKAGAYAVQGSASLFIDEIQGEYWNVVGLPLRTVYRLLKKIVQ